MLLKRVRLGLKVASLAMERGGFTFYVVYPLSSFSCAIGYNFYLQEFQTCSMSITCFNSFLSFLSTTHNFFSVLKPDHFLLSSTL